MTTLQVIQDTADAAGLLYAFAIALGIITALAIQIPSSGVRR